MKILITGAGGFLGKRLTQHLAKLGHEVIAVVRSLPSEEDVFFASPNITLLKQDLAELDCQSLPTDVEAIFSLAQSSHFRDFPAKAEDVFAVNVATNFKLLQWAVNNNVKKIVYASSGGIYGKKQGSYFNEEDLFAIDSPLGFYLGSKLCAEIIFQNYSHFFETAVILRPFFIYGPEQKKDMLIMRLIESVKAEQPIMLQGEDGLRLNPVYVDDAVLAFMGALELKGCHIFNIAGPDVLTLRQVVEIIAQKLNKKPIFEIKNEASADYVGNNEQMIKKLNKALTTFSDGIALTLGSSN